MKTITQLLIAILILVGVAGTSIYFIHNYTRLGCFEIATTSNVEGGQFQMINEQGQDELRNWTAEKATFNQDVFNTCVAKLK